MTIGIVGLGLIGASMAKTIKKHTDFAVMGIDKSQQVMESAMLDGTIDGVLDLENEKCDIVVVALYFIIKAVYDHIKKKKAIAEMLEKYSKQIGWFGEYSDDVVKHVVDRFKGHNAEYVKRQFGDYLHDYYLIQMMTRLVKIGNVNHQSKYMDHNIQDDH